MTSRDPSSPDNIIQLGDGVPYEPPSGLDTAHEGAPPAGSETWGGWCVDDKDRIKYRDDGLPEGCPITPLGHNDGIYYFLSQAGQVRALKSRDVANNQISDLLGTHAPLGWLYWPRKDKDGHRMMARDNTRAATDLIAACARAGVWQASGRVRGPGAWAAADGGLILHCGDRVLMGREWIRPGVRGDQVYPTAPPLPRPTSGDPGPAAGSRLMEIMDCWSFGREVDSVLLTGLVGAALIGGALDWRPMVWLTAESGRGKSTLIRTIRQIWGGACVSVAEPSAAYIRAKLGSSTLAVCVDEQESKADNRRNDAILDLMRISASGDMVGRGTADHGTVEHMARSVFLFASILPPPMDRATRSRLAMIELERPPAGKRPPQISEADAVMLGRDLRARLVAQWDRLAECFFSWRDQLIEYGHDARGADTFGMLLAVADVLANEAEASWLTDQIGLEWIGDLEPARLSDNLPSETDASNCLNYLLDAMADVYSGGTRHSVMHYIHECVTDPGGSHAQSVMAATGIKVTIEGAGTDRRVWLHVAANAGGLARIYEKSHWKASPGASAAGWTTALRRLAEPPWRAERWTTSIDGRKKKTTRLEITHLFEDGGASDSAMQ